MPVMQLDGVNRTGVTIAHILTTLGLLGGILAYANDTENKVVVTGTQQQVIIKNQDEIKKDFAEYKREQQQIQIQQMQLLHEIKGKLER